MLQAKTMAILALSVLIVSGLLVLQGARIANFTVSGMFIGFGPARSEAWWNNSWSYRRCLEINATVERVNWPIDLDMNFTDMMPSGTFDENSIRVIEYFSDNYTEEVPSQFEKATDYDAATNAVGTLAFMLNGTNPANTKRRFCIYYDNVENGTKPAVNYGQISYYFEGETINVNTTILRIYIDLLRGENLSGIYRIERVFDDFVIMDVPSEEDRPAEYTEYWNGSENVTFKIDNITIMSGPVRVAIRLNGTETAINGSETGRAYVEKHYYIYNNSGPHEMGGFIKIGHIIKNTGSASANFSSPYSGMPALDLQRTFPSALQSSATQVDNSNPFSYARAATEYEYGLAGIINMNQTGTENFFANNETETLGRIGMALSETEILPGSSITETALVYIGSFDDPGTEFQNILLGAKNEIMNISLPERMHATSLPWTNATTYNRKETVLIRLNVTEDPYNASYYVNASINNGTYETGDDIDIVLYDDGTHGDAYANDKSYSNEFQLDEDANLGEWEINFSIFDKYGNKIDINSTRFNITDKFNAALAITNKKVMVGRTVFAVMTVKNHRNDTYISGATINCSFNGSVEVNVNDLNNGTYALNFTAPSEQGEYELICNATKVGNFGNATDTFEAERGKTTVEIIPNITEINLSNITMYKNQSFPLSILLNNTGNATAFNLIVYFNLSTNWTAYPINGTCQELNKSNSCIRYFNITAPANATPGSYNATAIVNWTDLDETNSTNSTIINVTVESNPVMNITKTDITAIAKDGWESIIGNFTVLSTGNDALHDINFTCVSGEVCQNFSVEFYPSNISSLPNGAEQVVEVNLTVPQFYPYGNYTGTVNISSSDGSALLILNISVPAKTTMNITNNITNYTAGNVTMLQNETFSFSSNISNMGNGSARNITVNISLPAGWVSQPGNSTCSDQKSGDSCQRYFNLTIQNNTKPGNYKVNITVGWTNPDKTMDTKKSEINVTVLSRPLLDVPEDFIEGQVKGANETTIGNFTVLSIGNDALQNVNFTCVAGEVCLNFSVEFYPGIIPTLNNTLNQTVLVNVTVPSYYDAGEYSGIINVSSGNDNFDIVLMNVTIPAIKLWKMTPRNCSRSEEGGSGTVCIVNITNLGNTNLDFQITPDSGNQTFVNETSFTVPKNSIKTIEVGFDMNGTQERLLNATYIVDATTDDVEPDFVTLEISLLPTTSPLIVVYAIPQQIIGEGYVNVYANVTDRSSTGIEWVKLNATDPSKTTTEINMSLLGGSNLTWYARYPLAGNITKRGVYNLTVHARDNIGNTGQNSTIITLRASLKVNLSTLSPVYYQGDTATILYTLTDLNNTPLENGNVTFQVFDSSSNLLFNASRTTNSYGKVYPLLTFSLPSDASTGTYTLVAETVYYDYTVNETINETTDYNFDVKTRTVSVQGLFADIETAVVWYPDNIMRYSILVYNGEGRPVNADAINLTVYDPADNVYFKVNLSQISRNATGLYSYKHAMPANTPTGMFLAILDVAQGEYSTRAAKAFRVAKGGPYDLRLVPLESEVEQGDYFDFNIIVENKGEVSQDVFLEYWVVSQGETYYSASEAVYTPANFNQTFTRKADIYSTQPLGTAYIWVRMTYDNVQAPIYANSSFMIIAKKPSNITRPTEIVTVPISPTGAVISPNVSVTVGMNVTTTDLIIEKYTPNVTVARGAVKMETVTVRNTGKTEFKNVTFFITGIPLDWYNITPSKYAFLREGESAIFVITYNIPRNVNTGYYNATIHASAGVASDYKNITITVFTSVEELLQNDIKNVKNMLVELLMNMSIAEREGKDTTSIAMLIEDINTLIKAAEDSFYSRDYETSMKKIQEARVILERAIGLLATAPVKPKAEFPILPILFTILAVAIALVLIILYRRRKRYVVRPYITVIGRLLESIKGRAKSKKELMEEHEKIVDVLSALEKEKNEGIISLGTYKSMKKEFESKLEKLRKSIE